MRPKILVVEDDHALRGVLCRGLVEEDFDPVLAADGAAALRLTSADVTAAILDVGLPDADGRDVCQAMRANGFHAPVIFLTARHRLTDRLSGFSAGGDDYLPKPFHLAELAARLRAALRRATPRPAATADGLVLDAVGHNATVHGVPLALSPTEFRLLATLAAGEGAFVRRRALIRAGWPEGAHVLDNTLDQYLTRLRRKLREAGSGLTIGTARGIGHRLS
ncbi:DNA-binding response regulator [Streptomyces pluripotens]|uniref:DNA-binding response regulator n=1 Tax=Streptomyces pluripotens TaxID=1355015 RepID=A0A221NSV4_9ACTN|nr:MULTISPECIES: response regulator transcription factor [Streptomyces]ARP68828.1 DNA-binding response regulator [Streptomyces pluripotens]ASN23083.1 DNA-binding response regulator [Streptomyces pluripotens]MCH0556804.1 response regulator transcription factor [Streptomyces sp. MUM 16J]